MNRPFAVVCGLFLGVVFGCAQGPNGPAPATPVKGTVSMDGKPVAAAEIHFGMIGVPPRVLQIIEGKFTGEAPVGKNQVEIYIYVEGPPSDKYPGVTTKVNVSPQQYWGPSTVLDAEVTAGGSNEFKFDLSSR